MSAESEVLELCRAAKAPNRLWVMRLMGTPEVCMVLDLGQSEPRPGSKFERQDKRIGEPARNEAFAERAFG